MNTEMKDNGELFRTVLTFMESEEQGNVKDEKSTFSGQVENNHPKVHCFSVSLYPKAQKHYCACAGASYMRYLEKKNNETNL